jgi:hypothetical protein
MSRRKPAGFSRSAIKAAGANWSDVRQFNLVFSRLEKRRVAKVEGAGALAKSKIAWKIAVLQQALLYRIVELAEGCTKAWNAGNVLCSGLAARALFETVGLTLDFEAELEGHYKADDFEAMNRLANSQTFASREKEYLKENPDFKAKRVGTYIRQLEKRTGLMWAPKHYETLSEWCHPNGLGHYFAFATLDTKTGITTFSKHKMLGKGGMLGHILAVYLTLGFIEHAMDRLDDLVLNISEAH